MGPRKDANVKTDAQAVNRAVRHLLTMYEEKQPATAYLPKPLFSDNPDPKLNVLANASTKFKNVLLNSSREAKGGDDFTHGETMARYSLAADKASIDNVIRKVNDHVKQQFNAWLVRGLPFDEARWQRAFTEAKKDIEEIHKKAVDEIYGPGHPDYTPEKSKQEKEYLDTWKQQNLAELESLQTTALEQEMAALKDALNKQTFNLNSSRLQEAIARAGSNDAIWRRVDEVLPKYSKGGGASPFDSPPEDGVYYQEIGGELQKEGIAIVVDKGKATIFGKSDGYGDYEPTREDYNTLLNFIRVRCGSDKVVLSLNVGDNAGSEKGMEILRTLIGLARQKGMRVRLDASAEAYLNSPKGGPHRKAEIDKLVAEANAEYDRKNAPLQHLTDTVANRRIDTQANEMKQHDADRAVVAPPPPPLIPGGGPPLTPAVRREKVFLGCDPTDMAPLTLETTQAAQGALDKVKDRVETLEKTANLINHETLDLMQDIKQTLVDQESKNGEQKAAAERRMVTLAGRYDKLVDLKEKYQEEKEDLVSRLKALEANSVFGEAVREKLDPIFNGSFTAKIAASPLSVEAAALAPASFNVMTTKVKEERVAEAKEAEEKLLGPSR